MQGVTEAKDAPAEMAGPRGSTARTYRRAPAERRGRRLRARLALVVLAVVTLGSACTVTAGAHYQIDLVVSGYHFHVYQVPTSQIWIVHVVLCNQNARCTLDKVWDEMELNGIVSAAIGAHEFFDDTEDEGDFAAALQQATPANPSVNAAWQFGCLGGFRNTSWPWNDGDWYASAFNGDWCRYGESFI